MKKLFVFIDILPDSEGGGYVVELGTYTEKPRPNEERKVLRVKPKPGTDPVKIVEDILELIDEQAKQGT